MHTAYIPKQFCKEYAEISCGQLPLLIAVKKGLKPVLDELIPINKFQHFKKVCADYGLITKTEWAFVQVNENKILNSIDGKRLTTTKYIGVPFSDRLTEGFIRVFIAKSEEPIRQAQRFGWYPLVIKGRALHKPFIDHLRFGKALGYPGCCIDFFKQFNDHNKYNNLYETYKNSEEKPNFLCNCLFMDYTYSLIHHIPCSYNCKETIKFTSELLKEIEKEDPEYADKIKYYLKLPLLVFGEKNIFVFNGKAIGNEIYYDEFLYLG